MQPGRVVWQPLPLAIPPIRSLQWSNPSHIQQPIAPTPPPPYTYSAPGLVAPTVLSFDNPSTQVPTTSTSGSSKQSYIPVSSSRISSSSTLSGDNTYQTSVVRSAIPRSLRPAAGYPMVATAPRGQPRLPPPIENESVRPSADPRLTTLGASPVRGQLSSKQGAQPSRLPRYRTSTEAKAFRSSTRGHGPAVQDARHENPRPSRSSALPAATVATKFASDSSTILTSSADLSYPGPTLHAVSPNERPSRVLQVLCRLLRHPLTSIFVIQDSPTLFRSSLEYLTWPEYFQRVDYGKAIGPHSSSLCVLHSRNRLYAGRGTEPCNFGPPKRLRTCTQSSSPTLRADNTLIVALLDTLPPTFKMRKVRQPHYRTEYKPEHDVLTCSPDKRPALTTHDLLHPVPPHSTTMRAELANGRCCLDKLLHQQCS